MKAIITIIRKELLETLRDRRTLMTMIVIPILLFPVILSMSVEVNQYFSNEAKKKELVIGVDTKDLEHPIVKKLMEVDREDSLMSVRPFSDFTVTKGLIQEDSIQAALYFSGENASSSVVVWHDGSELDIASRVENIVAVTQQKIKDDQLRQLNIKPEDISGFDYLMQSTASVQETIGKLAGGFLPYVFIAFGFLGCMYPAIDLFTGEKERGTIETLLTAPVPRWQLLIGKMSVIVLSGLLSASLSLVGLFLSIRVFDLVENPEMIKIIDSILSAKFISLLFVLQIPLTIFFAGLLTPISIYAKSFKEAQSIITPLNIVVVLPAIVGFFPGIELNSITAFIPIVNIVLATKELVAGTLDYLYLFYSALVMSVFAAIAVFISYKQFEKETNILM